MYYGGIDLHKISLGALIIALGLLVDDAIIAVEMMVRKMEQGWDRVTRGELRLRSTAMPMLTGTLITAAGFLPIGIARVVDRRIHVARSSQVTAIALLISWIVVGRLRALPRLQAAADDCTAGARRARASAHDAVYRTRRSTGASARVVDWCVAHRRTVIGADASRSSRSAIVGFRLRAAAVLPRLEPARADRRPAPAGGLLVRGDRGAGRSSFEQLPRAAKRGHRQLRELRRQRQPALLPAARPAARATRTSASSSMLHEGHRGARARCARGCIELLRRRTSPSVRGARRTALENGPPVGYPGAVPRVGRGHRRRCARSPSEVAERDARATRTSRRATSTGTSRSKVDPARHRPGQGARCSALVAGARRTFLNTVALGPRSTTTASATS